MALITAAEVRPGDNNLADISSVMPPIATIGSFTAFFDSDKIPSP